MRFPIDARVRYCERALAGLARMGGQHKRINWRERIGTVVRSSARGAWVRWDDRNYPDQIDHRDLVAAE